MAETICIVDDEPAILNSLSSILEDEGYQVITATNGLEGMKLVRSDAPDLVILDIWMPEMDGLETTRTIIREDHDNSRPVIVAMTASVTLHDRNQCELAGMDNFISKPIHLEHLIRILKQLEDIDRTQEIA